jgi:hypothetical protein
MIVGRQGRLDLVPGDDPGLGVGVEAVISLDAFDREDFVGFGRGRGCRAGRQGDDEKAANARGLARILRRLFDPASAMSPAPPRSALRGNLPRFVELDKFGFASAPASSRAGSRLAHALGHSQY